MLWGLTWVVEPERVSHGGIVERVSPRVMSLLYFTPSHHLLVPTGFIGGAGAAVALRSSCYVSRPSPITWPR